MIWRGCVLSNIQISCSNFNLDFHSFRLFVLVFQIIYKLRKMENCYSQQPFLHCKIIFNLQIKLFWCRQIERTIVRFVNLNIFLKICTAMRMILKYILYLYTVGENIIATTKIRNNYVTIQTFIFPILRQQYWAFLYCSL